MIYICVCRSGSESFVLLQEKVGSQSATTAVPAEPDATTKESTTAQSASDEKNHEKEEKGEGNN